MFFIKNKKVASLVSAVAIMAACGITASAASDPSLAATDFAPDFSSLQEAGELTAIATVDPESIDGKVTLAVPADEAGLAFVVDAGVDVSEIDFSNIQEGDVLTVIDTVDPESVDGKATLADPADETGLAFVVDAGVDVSEIDFSGIQEGEDLTPIGAVPTSSAYATVTEAK